MFVLIIKKRHYFFYYQKLKFMLLSFIISITGLLFLLFNSFIFLKTRKGKDKNYKCLTFYLTILFAVELACNIIGMLKPNSNFFLSHYYFIIQFNVLSLFFYYIFDSKRLKFFIIFNFIFVAIVLGVQYYNNPSLYLEFNVLEIGLTSFLLIVYCIIHFYKYLKSSFEYFYFCFGLTFYLTSSMLIFLSGNTTLVFFEEPFYFDIWVFNSLFYILFQYLVFKEWKYLNDKNPKL